MLRVLISILLFAVPALSAVAHDSWLEAEPSTVPAGDAVTIRLLLGNHGNHHRDFKLAGKLDLEHAEWTLVDPDGARSDLKARAVDAGLGPREGYWTADVIADRPGLYAVLQKADSQHGAARSLKFGKTYFRSLGPPETGTATPGPGSAEFLTAGQPLEIVPLTDPTSCAVDRAVRVCVQYRNAPLRSARISYIPRGVILSEEFDDRYERTADADGLAEWTPAAAGDVLIAVHLEEPEERGAGYESTQYAATLTVRVHGADAPRTPGNHFP